MPLSDEAYNKYFGKWPAMNSDISKWILGHQPSPTVEQKDPPKGQFIYKPHNCEFPDPWETPIGAIWACGGYREGRMCYDQWIVVVEKGSRHWELFQRNIR